MHQLQTRAVLKGSVSHIPYLILDIRKGARIDEYKE